MHVALSFNSSRAHTVADPLRAVGIRVSDFRYTDQADVIVTDSLNSEVYSHWLRRDTPVFFRLRGDMWREREQEGRSTLGSWLDDAIKLRLLDGVIAPDEYLAAKVRSRPAPVDVAEIGLPIDADAWPVEYHDRDGLELLTLTNFDYWGKIEPLQRWFPALNPWLEATESTWNVAGNGVHAEECRTWADEYDRIQYAGFVDATEALRSADVLLHPSGFDIECPNAILEGYASGLPVITTAFEPFVGTHETVARPASLPERLKEYREIHKRRSAGIMGRSHVRTHHSAEEIGRQYRRLFEHACGEYATTGAPA